nr:biopolymer transporter ExbD [uncultured Carboxylicivirga sp.]
MKSRESQEVNAGSMADIAFLLLIFFLVATTMDSDTGLTTLLPPYQNEEDVETPPKNDRNVFEVLVNGESQIMVEKKLMNISQLTEATKKFIVNPTNNVNLSDKELKKIPFFGSMEVSKGIISLQTTNDTPYQIYLSVQNEIVRAFNELRNEAAINKFGKEYQKLESAEKEAVRQLYPKLISEAEPVRMNN